MGQVHVLFPSLYRDGLQRIRERFPSPWTVKECARGYVVMDANETRLTTIVVTRDDRADGLSRQHAFALAHEIAKMGSVRSQRPYNSGAHPTAPFQLRTKP